ncbi:hypothetical protein KY284_014393 [Solanum tuberosum]|nr:hypothetical protein KY284_014393 [Solanum tuberosum]
MTDKSLLSIFQKFELKRNPFLLQLMGNLPEEELERSTLATKLNGYAAELCSSRIQKRIDAKINDIIKKDDRIPSCKFILYIIGSEV